MADLIRQAVRFLFTTHNAEDKSKSHAKNEKQCVLKTFKSLPPSLNSSERQKRKVYRQRVKFTDCFSRYRLEYPHIHTGITSRYHAVIALTKLLIRLTLVFYPACGVMALRIAVRPVNNAPFRVPFILAIKIDRIPRAQRIDAPRQIDVVRHEYRPP